MSIRFFFIFLIVAIAGLAASFFMAADWRFSLFFASLGVAIIVLIMLYLRIVMPTRRVELGMELIGSQDFNNRLRKVGERNADRVVELFNAMIDRLREERLKNLEQENLLSQLIETSPMGVAILDYDGRLSRTNPAFLKILNLQDNGSIIAKRPDEWNNTFASKLERMKPGTTQVISLGDAMRYRCYRLSFIRRGFKIEFFLVESLTEEVREAERSAYEKVIRILSHEVNNTMCGVRSVLGLISDSEIEADLKEVAESCDDRCDKLCNFVNSYADVVRLPQPELKSADLASEIKKSISFLSMVLPENVELITEISPKPVMVRADMPQIQQALVNIVKNAGESIADKGFVKIRVLENHGRGMLEIINNGMPISEEVAANMFRPFYTSKPNGHGLGLTLTSEILSRHCARFSLQTYPDLLTRFRIEF